MGRWKGTAGLGQWQRGRFAAVALGPTLLIGVGACALLEGDQDYALFTGSDATPDQAHTTPATEAGHDARHEATADVTVATHDAGSGDAHDAAVDQTSAKDAGHDAGHDGGHDAGHDSGHDATHEGGFCGNVTQPPDSSFFCDDFDETPYIPTLGSIFTLPHDFAVQADAWVSPPRALSVSVPIDGGAGYMPFISRANPPVRSVTLEYDILVESLPIAGGNQTSGFFFFTDAGNVNAYLSIDVNSDGGLGNAYLYELGGSAHQFVPWPGGWVHVSLSFSTQADGQVVDTLSLNDTVVEANFPMASSCTLTGGGEARIGFNFIRGAGLDQVVMDNVVLYSSN